ncbi:Tetratricopeptide repeat-containing protein [Gloeomargarita lithophora Alchichica-D10]|uniref:Tetratricopeptide repeat-containing protein n=1 Tax=Gloeomargarita lithophora Alchichica-D10 TaxID=1188229 RepID=A0A1J0A9E9_9CYAN|nr:Sll0314/Alr1548 family TPR repeat-containing protein [Gloeomargarita lithophora]APB32568.1 Tetratricopeptide repeat-containing protein [Gloeomargarita lithophora Alchichica-D10]
MVKKAGLAILTAVTLWLSAVPVQAGDPFRRKPPRPIDAKTEQVFEQVFIYGNYSQARSILTELLAQNPKEPLVYALSASIAYLDGDLTNMAQAAAQTMTTATALQKTDPLRGHLYVGVAHFLAGGVVATENRKNLLLVVPQLLDKVQVALGEFDKAAAVNPNDPELNLIRGFADLLLAINIPFSNVGDAVNRLQNSGAPPYLVHRGLALAYRDLKQFPDALAEVDKALIAAPNQPELQYLRAQILVGQQNYIEGVKWFDQSLAMEAQLPPALVRQIRRERERAQRRVVAAPQ